MATVNTEKESEFLDDFAKPPFLRRVQIQGYKSIEFCDVTFEPLTVLVGRNASGKSNFLDALGFLADVMRYNLNDVVTKRNGWRAISSKSPPPPQIDFEIELRFHSFANELWKAEYSFSFAPNEQNEVKVKYESLSLARHSSNDQFGFSIENEKIISLNLPLDHFGSQGENSVLQNQLFTARSRRLLISAIGTQPIVDAVENFRTSRIYDISPSEIRKHQPISGSPFLSADGRNLARAIAGLEEIEPETVDRIIAFLQLIVPAIRTLCRVEYGDFETVQFELEKSLKFDASSMSDGTLRILAALVAAYQIVLPGGYPGFVGIEEPETSLHPAAMHALVDALIEATGRTQIILSTHSTELLDNPNIKPGNIRVVEMQDGKTVIAPVDEASLEIIRRDLDTLGGLERQNQLEPNADDVQRQQEAAAKLRENGK